jgi:hypothetical protein
MHRSGFCPFSNFKFLISDLRCPVLPISDFPSHLSRAVGMVLAKKRYNPHARRTLSPSEVAGSITAMTSEIWAMGNPPALA